MSLRNGVPERARRLVAGANASRTESPHARSSPAWWISSRMTIAPGVSRARTAELAATCWYVVTMPCMSGARAPLEADHSGWRCRPKRVAARVHCSLRWAVGATITSRRPGTPRSSRNAAARAKVVLPAPGVATVRKSGPVSAAAANRSSAAFCQGRRRTTRDIGGGVRNVERAIAGLDDRSRLAPFSDPRGRVRCEERTRTRGRSAVRQCFRGCRRGRGALRLCGECSCRSPDTSAG